MGTTDPIRLTTKASNNRLRVIREEMGLTMKAMAAQLEISHGTYWQLESLRLYPSVHLAEKVATHLGLEVGYIFPEYLQHVSKRVSINTVPETEILQLTNPEVLMLEAPVVPDLKNADLREILKSKLETLTVREEKVVTLAFGLDGNGERSIREIAKLLRVSPSRIHQVLSKSLRKLRHPSRSKALQEFLED